MIRLYFVILSFMSRIPVPVHWTHDVSVEHYSRGVVTLPFVGLLLGGLSGLVFWLFQAWFGTPLAAFGAVLSLALLTGGFHLDGVADTCDGVFSARTRERMLEIMHDSRLGTHGGLGLIFILLGKILVLNTLASRGFNMWPVIACASVVARSTVVLLMYRQRYARKEGMGNIYIGKLTKRQAIVTLSFGAVFTLLLAHAAGIRAFLITVIMIFLLGQSLKRTLGGQTGDTLGAAIEMGELIFLLALL